MQNSYVGWDGVPACSVEDRDIGASSSFMVLCDKGKIASIYVATVVKVIACFQSQSPKAHLQVHSFDERRLAAQVGVVATWLAGGFQLLRSGDDSAHDRFTEHCVRSDAGEYHCEGRQRHDERAAQS